MVNSATFLSFTTFSAGSSTWVSASAVTPATVLHVLNSTGTNITFRRIGDTGATFILPTSMAWSFRGLTNTNQIQFQRTDLSNTPVTFYGEAEFEFKSC